MEKIKFKNALKNQAALIVEYIHKIAIFEKLDSSVKVDENMILNFVFKKKIAKVFFIYCDKKVIGFCLYFLNYSTFVGKAGIHLEDLYIDEEFRHHGIGKKAIQHLCKIATKNNMERIERTCLKWNKNAYNFYLSLGAIPQNERETFRLTTENITKLAK